MTIDFEAYFPNETPASDIIYVSGNFNDWNPAGLPLTRQELNTAKGMVVLQAGQEILYKYTRGTWESVEVNYSGDEIQNRKYVIAQNSKSNVILKDTIKQWHDILPAEEEIVIIEKDGRDYCDKCNKTKNSLSEYKFYTANLLNKSQQWGRSSMLGDEIITTTTYKNVDGPHKVWICDECILRTYFRDALISILFLSLIFLWFYFLFYKTLFLASWREDWVPVEDDWWTYSFEGRWLSYIISFFTIYPPLWIYFTLSNLLKNPNEDKEERGDSIAIKIERKKFGRLGRTFFTRQDYFKLYKSW